MARRPLPRGAAGAAAAGAICRGLRHGRGQRDLLPAAEGGDGARLDRTGARGLPLRGEGEPLPDPHEAPPRHHRRGRPLLGAARAAAALPPAGPGPLAAAGELPTRRRPARRRTRPAAAGRPLLRVPSPELVRPAGPRVARRTRRLAGDRRRQAPAAAGGGAGGTVRLPTPPLRPPWPRRQLFGNRARRLAPADRRLAVAPSGLRLPEQRLEGLCPGEREISAGGPLPMGGHERVAAARDRETVSA